MVLMHESQDVSMPDPVGPDKHFLQTDAPEASFFAPEQALLGSASPAGAEREAYCRARQDTGSGTVRVNRAARAMSIMLGVPPGSPNIPAAIIGRASWRDKYLAATVLRDADPHLKLPLWQRVSAGISGLLFGRHP